MDIFRGWGMASKRLAGLCSCLKMDISEILNVTAANPEIIAF